MPLGNFFTPLSLCRLEEMWSSVHNSGHKLTADTGAALAPAGKWQGPGPLQEKLAPWAGLWPGFFLMHRLLCAPLKLFAPHLLDSGASTGRGVAIQIEISTVPLCLSAVDAD